MAPFKNCAYCGQDIPTQATVCPLCHRNQPGTRLTTASRNGITNAQAGRLAVIVAVASGALMAWATRGPQPMMSVENRTKRSLQVSGTRHPRGIEVTNRETEPLSSCRIKIPEQWQAGVQKIEPLETKTVLWAEFRNAGGTEMPTDIGQTARYAIVTCDSHKEQRKSTVLSLR